MPRFIIENFVKDHVLRFIDDACIQSTGYEIRAKQLLSAFHLWQKDCSPKDSLCNALLFRKILAKHGFSGERKKGDGIYYLGFKLKDSWQQRINKVGTLCQDL